MAEPQVDLSATSPTVTDYSNGVRHVRFVAMQHIAQPAFYENARRIVRAAQQAGGVHFYEYIDMYALSDTDQRKVRKLTRFMPMPDVYARLAVIAGQQMGLTLEAQQFTDLVGLVDGSDVNADVSPRAFLAGVEALTGPIVLDAEDLATPLTDPISTAIPTELWLPAVLDGRNAHLAWLIHDAAHEKIVISYGAAHETGWLAELRKLDPSWGVRAR